MWRGVYANGYTGIRSAFRAARAGGGARGGTLIPYIFHDYGLYANCPTRLWQNASLQAIDRGLYACIGDVREGVFVKKNSV